MSRAGEQARLWLPLYWPAWLGIGFMWLVDKLPWTEKRALARTLGWLAFHFIGIRRRVVLTNLKLCFPEKSVAEITALARAHYDSLALGLFEVCAGWWAQPKDLPPHRLICNEHKLDALAVSGARPAARHVQDALDSLRRHGLARERPNHPPLPHDIRKLHPTSMPQVPRITSPPSATKRPAR